MRSLSGLPECERSCTSGSCDVVWRGGDGGAAVSATLEVEEVEVLVTLVVIGVGEVGVEVES